MSKKLLILVSILALSLMFVGCGDDEVVSTPEPAAPVEPAEPVAPAEPAEPAAPAEEVDLGQTISGIKKALDEAVAAESITAEQRDAFMDGCHSGAPDMAVMMEVATAAGLDMSVMMSMPQPEPGAEGMSAEQMDLIKQVVAVMDEKIAAGELTEEMKYDCVSKIHNGEITIMEVMEQLGMSAE